MSTRASKEPSPSKAKAFAVQITRGVASHREGSRDRVDGECDVGRDDRDHHEQQRRAVETPASRTNSRRPLNSAVVGIRPPDESEDAAVGGVGRLRVAAEGAIGHVQEQAPEHEDHGFDRLDERQACRRSRALAARARRRCRSRSRGLGARAARESRRAGARTERRCRATASARSDRRSSTRRQGRLPARSQRRPAAQAASQPMLQAIASPRRATRPRAKYRCSTASPTRTAAAAAATAPSSTTGPQSSVAVASVARAPAARTAADSVAMS